MTTQKKTLDTSVLVIAIIGSLVLLNVISVGLFGRLDWTRNREFTLSQATRDLVKNLSDPVTITAYFSRDLPPPYSTNARYVKDLLEEYYAASKGNLRYEFVDPLSEETEADKEAKKEVKQDIFGRSVREETSVERDLRNVGIPPVQVRVNEDDKIEVKRAYMGIAIRHGDKKEVIPVVQDTAGLEYDLTTMIRKVSRAKAPKVALITGHNNPDVQKEMGQIYGLLGQLYDITTLDLSSTPSIGDDVDAILVIGPKTPFSEAEQRAIDQFVMSGRSAAFMLGAVDPDLQTMQANPIDSGLAPLLESYGVKIDPGLVLDAECATMSVMQQRGFLRIAQPVKYPFVPVPKALDPDHPLTRGLSQVSFAFMSPLSLSLPEGSAVKGDILVKSSAESWVQSPPYNLDPMQRWTSDTLGQASPRDMLITLRGPVKSYFHKGAEETGMSVDPTAKTQAGDARILVAGGFAFVLDQFMSPGNQALMLNLLDWMVLDDALLAVRARGLAAAPLDEVSDGTRNMVKGFNIVGLPLAFVAFGLLRWRMREGRRQHAAL
ncbi:MAG: GldG family protein [Pseudomonadota bacterium]